MTQDGFKRKLTSIFSADAVGYSRLMGEDEAATVHTLTSFRNVISIYPKRRTFGFFKIAITYMNYC